jgi:cytochrome c-type biogenesis protein CcmH/NrfG
VKKESIITAVVFLGVGFLVGYIFQSERVSSLEQKLAAAASPMVTNVAVGDPQAAPGTGQAASADPTSLPAGHPPVDDATMIRFLEDEASEKPNDPVPPLKLANFLFDEHKFADALPWYEKSLAVDPKNVDARTDLGTAYFNLGEPEKAVREFDQSLKADPNHQATLFNLIVVSIEGTHNLRTAQRAWERLERLNPNYPNLDRLKQELDAARQAPRGVTKN